MMHRTRKKKKKEVVSVLSNALSVSSFFFSFFFFELLNDTGSQRAHTKKKGCKFLFKGSQRSLNERFYFGPIKKTEEKEANNEKSETVK